MRTQDTQNYLNSKGDNSDGSSSAHPQHLIFQSMPTKEKVLFSLLHIWLWKFKKKKKKSLWDTILCTAEAASSSSAQILWT